ncbi:MAG: hypothetical protein SF053_10285 [Bacteroidia bacterium]|nr:hypothetical protein [Bacteroidia bacterium]
MFKLQVIWNLILFTLRGVPRNRQTLERWQTRKLRSFLAYVKRRSPFFREALAAAGDDWRQLPLMNKQRFMDAFDTLNTAGIRKADALALAQEAEATREFSPEIHGITVGLSTGTSGNRGVFLVSKAERAQWAGMMFSRVAPITSLRRRKLAFFLRANSNLYSSVQSSVLEFGFFDLLHPVEANITKLGVFQPDILVAQPSMLRLIARAQAAGKIHIRPERIISVAEVLEPTDRAYCEDVFGQTLHQVYQCTEGFLAATCVHGTLHWNEDLIVLEKKYLDETQTRYHPVITDFTRTTQPVIRYELNDIIVPPVAPCPCGSPMEAIGHIEGRMDDVFWFRSAAGVPVAVFPDFVRRAVIRADQAVSDYMVVQEGPDTLALYLDDPLPADRIVQVHLELRSLLTSLGVMSVSIRDAGPLPPLGDTKLRRIRRMYHPDFLPK